MYPSREEFSELIYYISELKHQYTNKIDEQSTKINEQSMIIEELLWQIRELSDKIRQVNQWKSDMEIIITNSKRKFDEMTKSCVCRYENHIPKNRIINNRQCSSSTQKQQQRANQKINDNIKSNDEKEIEDDVYETIEFSDSSHIYTEPVKSDYGALRKINIEKNIPSKQTTSSPVIINNNNIKRSPNSTKKNGMKKSTRIRNLQKYPAIQDVSKTQIDSESEIEEKVELRRTKQTKSSSRRSNSKAIVSEFGVSSTHQRAIGNMESFIPQRDVSGILINFDCSKSRVQSALHERVSF